MIRIKNLADIRRSICLFLFFIAVFGFMPTNLKSDQMIWIGATALLALCTLWDVCTKGIKLYIGNSFLIYLVLFAYGMLSMLWSRETLYTMYYLRMKFPFIVVGVLCVGAYMYDEESVDRIFKIIALAACVAAVRFCYYTPWDTYLRGDFGILLDEKTNYNNYTTPMCLAYVISAYYAFVRKKKGMLIPTIALAAVLVLAGSRKTIVVLPLIALLYLIDARNVRRFIKGLLWATLFVLVFIFAIMNIEFLEGIRDSLLNAINAYLFGEETEVGKSTLERLYLMETAKEVWWDNPILGVGWNNFQYLNVLGLYSHNNYLELLSCLGIVGFVIYYSQYFRALFIVFVNKNRNKEVWTKLMIGFLACMLMIEIGDMVIYSRETTMLFLIVLTMYDRYKNKGAKIVMS